MKASDSRLLREFVREVLKEDDTGGYGYVPTPGGGGFGGGMGYSSYGGSLKSIFVQPFIDAGKVIKASSAKALLRIKTLAKTAIETILTTMIPFLKSNYEHIFKVEQEQLKKLKDKYRDAFKGVDAAFTKDVMILSFMVSPQAFITTRLAMKAPEAVADMLDVLCVGNEGLSKYFDDLKKRLDAIDKDLKDDVSNYRVGSDGKMVPRNARGPYLTAKKRDLLKKAGIASGLARDGETIAEDVAPQQAKSAQQRKGEEVANTLRNPDVQKMLVSAPRVQEMQRDANALVQRLSTNVLAEASRVLSAQTLEDVQKIFGRPVEVPNLQELSPEDQQAAKDAVLSQVKTAAKDFYTKTIQADIEGLQRDGVDPNNLYIRSLQGILSKLAAF